MGAFIRTDARKQTSVPGVFACGDAACAAGSVFLAVGDGAMAGTAVHQSLVFG
jgi:thioredoxin reductase